MSLVVDSRTCGLCNHNLILIILFLAMESLQELVQYLNPDTRLDLKTIALEHVLSEYLSLKVYSNLFFILSSIFKSYSKQLIC